MAGRALSHRKAPSSLRLLPQVIPDRTCTVGKPQGSVVHAESLRGSGAGLGLRCGLWSLLYNNWLDWGATLGR